MQISELISKNLIETSLKSRTKEAVLSEIVERLHRHNKIKDRKEVLGRLLKREELGSTGIGNGIAIPHARIPELKEAVLFFGLSRKGIDFGSPDKVPVHLAVLFLTPLLESSLHLKILSKISQLLRNKLFISQLMQCSSNDELYQALQQLSMGKEGFLVLGKEEIYLELASSDEGISEESAARRLEVYGQNKLKTIKKTPFIIRFLVHFTNLLAILMWIGGGLSFLAGMPEAGWACLVVIFVNALFSFWQEFKAERAIDALKKLIPSFTRAIRGGKERKIPTDELVPGDIILIEEGDNISADARLIEAHELRVNNSAFSGESKLSHKISEGIQAGRDFLWLEMPNLVFAGTSVASGMGKAVVIATGMGTEIGKIAYLTQTLKEDMSPLQREVNRISRLIAAIAVAMGLIFFFVGFSFTKMTLIAAAMFAIGMILANVPQGLMPTLTLSLSMAVQRMAKKHALIKKLSSVETLGCTNVICTDKTGTLTTNQMSVRKLWINGKIIDISGSGYEPSGAFSLGGKELSADSLKNDNLELLLRNAILCNTAKLIPPAEAQGFWSIIGDPTEGALLTLAKKSGLDFEKERQACPSLKRFPFESVRKRMSSINKLPDGTLRVFVKGAPKEILELSNKIVLGGVVSDLAPEKRIEISGRIDDFAKDGLRVLGFAFRSLEQGEVPESNAQSVERDLIFIGVTAMYDPPRPEVKDAISLCKKAGIRVVMITGDYQITALSIARQVGIISSDGAEVITGADFANLTDEQLKDKVTQNEVVFARVNPDHKLKVVNIFKELGNIVAVTGDGVNDAPALKRADIGVAMGLRGTDVAKESAEMILVDDNFASIVSAIEEGRAVFENIKKFITYIFAHLVPEAVPYIFYVLFKTPVPITVMQILAIDLGTETVPALALGVEKPEPGIMEQAPRPKKKGVVDKLVLIRGYIVLGLLNSAAVISAYYFVLLRGGWRPGVQLEPNDTTFANPLHLKATTVVFVGIVVMQIANVFACRSEKYSVFKIGIFNNKLIIWGILFELLLTCAIIYMPIFQKIFNTTGLGWQEWVLLLGLMLAVFAGEELRKKFTLNMLSFTRNKTKKSQVWDFDYINSAPEALLEKLNSSQKGLAEEEAKTRLEEYGFNEPAKKKKRTILFQIISKFINPLVIVLLVIAGFSLFFGEKVSAVIVILMAVLSVFLSFIQEYRAGKEAEKLSEMVRATATVYRNGKPKEIKIKEIVPGDIVDLFAGDMIPADLRIVSCKDLFINQATLTGESFPVEKTVEALKPKNGSAADLSNIAFMGSSVVSGTALGVVVKTGLATQFGELSRKLSTITVQSGFDKGIRAFTWLMIKAMLALVLVIFAINAFNKGNIIQALLFALSVAVGLTPEMLPMLVAINLSKGAIAMSKKEVIVKRLNAIQNFGAMNVLCTDKTGTLTLDKIILERYCDVVKKDDEDVLRFAYINSFYQTGLKNILDRAILKHGKLLVKQYKKADEVPFDFSRKVMSVIVEFDEKHRIITKGAPEEVFKRCTKYELDGEIIDIDQLIIADLKTECDDLSEQGFRVLAIAYKDFDNKKEKYSKDDEQDLILKGYVAFLDPPKPSARKTIEMLKGLGIDFKVLTGDNELVTKKICSEVGLDVKGIANGAQVEKASDPELNELVKITSVFARLSPLQKERVIRALHKNNHIVGYLGDGINDAPALKSADVGISVNNAVDIAKESADIILLKKSLLVLGDGVIEGRKTFGNILKYIKMGSSSNFGNMVSMTGASLFLPFLPMLPIQILLNNFLYDISQIAIPSDAVDKEYLLKSRPWNINYIKKFMITLGPVSSLFDFITFGVLLWVFRAPESFFHTGWFLESLCTQTLVIHVIRTGKIPFIESKPSQFLIFTSVYIVTIGLVLPFTPLGKYFGFVAPPPAYFIALILIVSTYLFLVQRVKSWFIRRYGYE